MDNKQQSNPQIQIKASDEMLKGAYANMAQISHGAEEFILDFANMMPPTGQLVARVIISPSHAKRLVQALNENIKKYEEKFGTISLAVVPDQQMGFRTE